MIGPGTITSTLSIRFAQVLADFATETSDIHNHADYTESWCDRALDCPLAVGSGQQLYYLNSMSLKAS